MNPAEFINIARSEREFWWYRGMEQILFRLLDPFAASHRIRRVVEAGCGTGHMASRLGERYAWRVFPTDLQMEGLRYGSAGGVKRLAQADIAALPFPDGAFDIAVCLDVIVHFARGEEAKAVEELARVLVPGGLMLLRASALDILRSSHSRFTIERQRFTRARLKRLVSDHGVKVLRCTYANSLLLPVAFTKFRIIERLRKQEPQSGVQPVSPWLDTLLYRFLKFESWWIRAGWNFPLGQSLVLIGEKTG